MRTLTTLYIPSELKQKLKDHGNQSALVSKLLADYFKKQDKESSNELSISQLEEKRKLLEEKKALDELELEELDNIVNKRKEYVEDELEKKEKKKLSRIESYKSSIALFFDISPDELPELAEMYDLEKSNYSSLFEWGKAKKLQEKK